MTWAAVGAAAVGVVGSYAMNSSGGKDKNGGAGATTQTKDPWLPAQPWLLNNMASGQALQQQYTDQPFSAQQQQAYNNQYAQSDYMRQLVPSLLGQMQNQQVGFDRNNPQAKPNAFNWGLQGGQGSGANLGMGLTGAGAVGSMQAAQAAQAAIDAANRNKKPAAQDDGPFFNQADMLTGANMSGLSQNAVGGLLGQGKYGAFTYGMTMPTPGTQAYRDMSSYFANGGADPNGFYGRGAAKSNNPYDYMMGGPGVSVGDGVGVAGSAASVGSSANF